MKHVKAIRNRMARLKNDSRGALAVEFAMLFPLLLVSYLFAVDVTLYMDDQRRIKYLGESLAQIAATFPAYDQNARAAMRYNLDAQLQYLQGRKVNVEIVCVTLKDGAPSLVFEPNLLNGENSGIDWALAFNDMGYRYGEQIIMVSAKANRTPFLGKYFGLLTEASHVAQTQSYYSRPYIYETGIADPDYYNMP